ncbi:MAG: hypothetical protein NDJ92_02155 [Thermoanaerobaculia bacterium]|nr:hypothetical protein [Thermoanaerobaculia bacterium]
MSKRISRFTRREFIVAGSAGVAAVAAAPGSLFAAQTGDGAVPARLSIGYWLGSARLPRIADWREPDNGSNQVVDAASLVQGDFEFLRGGVQVNVVGMPPSLRPTGLRSLDVRAHFNADLDGGTDLVPFGAWSYRNDGVEKVSPGVRFHMPIKPETGLVFSMETESERTGRLRGVRPGGGEFARKEAVASISLSGDGPKLLRGVYFLAISDSAVAWSDYEFRMRSNATGSHELVRMGGSRGAAAEFPYVVVTLDHGAER